MFTAGLFMVADRELDKEDVVHTYYVVLLSRKKRRSTAICDNMDGPGE